MVEPEQISLVAVQYTPAEAFIQAFLLVAFELLGASREADAPSLNTVLKGKIFRIELAIPGLGTTVAEVDTVAEIDDEGGLKIKVFFPERNADVKMTLDKTQWQRRCVPV